MDGDDLRAARGIILWIFCYLLALAFYLSEGDVNIEYYD